MGPEVAVASSERPQRTMLDIRDALEMMLPGFAPLGAESVSLLQANGRVLFDDVIATLELPEFDNSAMDGFAVRHADLSPGGALPVHAEIRAGGGTPAPLPPGCAARIFTGAPLPQHADTVVIQENTRRREQLVEILE